MGFDAIIGYILGLIIVLVVSGICLKPLKIVLRFVINSLVGLALVALINLVGSFFGIHIGVNPVSGLLLGLLGVPGIIMILLAQIFY